MKKIDYEIMEVLQEKEIHSYEEFEAFGHALLGAIKNEIGY